MVAVDGSEASMKAVDHAARLAKQGDAELFALHVVRKPPFELSGEIAEYYRDARRAGKRWLREVETTAARHGISVRIEILVDASSVVDGILGYAETNQVGLIVTGTRGITPSKRLLMGSIARGLVDYAHCTVLVVR